LLGAIVILIPAVILVTRHNKSCSPTPSPSPAAWNESDYESSNDYYNKLPAVRDFIQADNLRLDHLSSPQFHPEHGKTVIYLRQQYHMPDSSRSTTTLHWTDLETNQTVQLTRPIWGINDQQVR
jgi:hypothetical protein